MSPPKLKSLKVAELKDILTRARVSFPSKATKADLLSKIAASAAALSVYSELHEQTSNNDDLLAPPEEVDWNSDVVPQPSAVVAPPIQGQPEKPVANVKPVASNPPSATKPTTQQDEEEKRRARAARFAATPSTAADDEEAKLKARAARFGVPAESKPSATSPSTKVDAAVADSPRLVAAATARQKRSSPDEADPEELEKRKKRAQRFGLSEPVKPVKPVSSFADDVDPEELEKRRKRAERFGLKEHIQAAK